MYLIYKWIYYYGKWHIYIYIVWCVVLVLGLVLGLVFVLVLVLVLVFVSLGSMSWKGTRLEHLYTRRVYSESNRQHYLFISVTE